MTKLIFFLNVKNITLTKKLKLTKNNKIDILEVLIILTLILMIIVIYVPVAIWEEENHYTKESRFRMNNLYDMEVFYKSLTGSFSPDFHESLTIVNAVRDSVVADSLFIEKQKVFLNGKTYMVDVYESFAFEFDTTFGFLSFRKDTILDTTLQIVVFDQDLGREDSIYIRKSNLIDFSGTENFRGVVNEEPTLRIELVEYYKTFLPDSATYYCPLTGENYDISISEDGSSFSVASPIKNTYVEPRYLFFSFKANSHGIIQDGTRSWE